MPEPRLSPETQIKVTHWLHDLEREHGTATPAMIVELARDKKCVAHDWFTWDVQEGFEKNLLAEARQLLAFRIRVTETTVAPRFIHDPRVPATTQAYVSMNTARSDQTLSREIMIQEFKRAGDMLRRARRVAEALDLTDEVESVIESIDALQQRAAAGVNAQVN